jgi:hypothetical protein
MLPENDRSWRLGYFEEVGVSLGRSFEAEAVRATQALDRLHARRRRAARESMTFTLALYLGMAAILGAFPSTRSSALSLAAGTGILVVAVVLLGVANAVRRRRDNRVPIGVRGVHALGGFSAIPAVAARSLTRDVGVDGGDGECTDDDDEQPVDLSQQRELMLDAYETWVCHCLPEEEAREVYFTLLQEFEGPLGELVEMSRRLV